MVKQMLTEEFGVLAAFALFSVLFAIAAIVTSFLVRPKASCENKNSTYECGIKPKTQAQIKFSAKYYILAILFIVFEVETIFLFPFASSFKKLGAAALLSALAFVLILLIGWAYAWRRDFFDYK